MIATTAPTPQRHQHDRVTRDAETLADTAGAIGLPFRVESLLGRLERHGDIGARERAAGEEFARLFQLAHLDPIRAADVLRGDRAGASATNHGSERARRKVGAALDALGGIGSPCGGCAWFVLGCETSLRQWSLREGWAGKPIREQVAKGILVGALGTLAEHFA